MAKNLSLKLNSNLNELDRIDKFVSEIGSVVGIEGDLRHHIMLVLTEAVTNAILHGNKESKSKFVVLEANITTRRLILSVQDEGDGFDPESIPSPIKKENLLKSSGRGIWLIHEFADNVSFSDRGRKITIEFTL